MLRDLPHPLYCLIPLLCLLLIAPLTPMIDLAVADSFYSPTGFSTQALGMWLYTYGTYPAMIIALGATGIWLLSYRLPRLISYKRAALVLFLSYAIGAGLVVNYLFKDHWGRPRPKQIERYGGHAAFQAFYQPNFTVNERSKFKSFPSGHASTGFFFLSLGLIGLFEKMRKLFWFGLMAGLIWGGILGYVRMAQGGHFFSDIVVSGLCMWLTGYLCCLYVYKKK
ncbi:MAG: phosphatase PAP2 family protein [Chlamydiia bacterium]|nr:phosphatase PAP2 family protein [Chlamydiia bacterium]